MLRESLMAGGRKLPFKAAMKPMADVSKNFVGRIDLSELRQKLQKQPSLNKPLPNLPPTIGEKVTLRERADKLGLMSKEDFKSMRTLDAIGKARERLSAWSALNGLNGKDDISNIKAKFKNTERPRGHDDSTQGEISNKQRRSGGYFSDGRGTTRIQAPARATKTVENGEQGRVRQSNFESTAFAVQPVFVGKAKKIDLGTAKAAGTPGASMEKLMSNTPPVAEKTRSHPNAVPKEFKQISSNRKAVSNSQEKHNTDTRGLENRKPNGRGR
ncbi:hypothetical protein [Ochrobactrum sp. BTU1]|uniref:hypothetical protein n=1 Tax=Ochrobactrum sp. BTU1 TaxID=2840456 RepID=UPI001C049B7B|nr:hypothetical protein KMS41_23280 [Ochrobactrum sp. BTU1]